MKILVFTNRNRLIGFKNELMVARRGEAWGRGEFGMDMYTLLHLKWITNKDLPCSTGNSVQCYVTVWTGKEFGENGYLYVYMAQSLHCSPETVNVQHCLLTGYTPKQNSLNNLN